MKSIYFRLQAWILTLLGQVVITLLGPSPLISKLGTVSSTLKWFCEGKGDNPLKVLNPHCLT